MVVMRPVQGPLQVQPPVIWNLNFIPAFATKPEIINIWMGQLKLWEEWRHKYKQIKSQKTRNTNVTVDEALNGAVLWDSTHEDFCEF